MITVEPIQNLDGFGTGQSATEYFYSQGMCRTQYGLTPGWVCSDEASSGSLTGLGLINWFSASSTNIYGIDAGGLVYGAPFSTLAWSKQYTPSISSHGNGMIVDQTGRVLVAGDHYLNKWDGNTLNYTDGSVQLNAGSASILGIGTNFTSDMVGKQVFFIATGQGLYTVSAVTDATHLTLNTTWGGSTTAAYYTIYMGSTEQWKDFGSAFQITGMRPVDIYQDWVVFGNGNAIAILNTLDDSFNNQGLTLPTGYNVAALRSGVAGILVGVNFNNRGAIFLWNATANGSISEWIWFNSNIQAIVPTNEGAYGYYVITKRGIFLTNGYIVEPVYKQLPDDRYNSSNILAGILPQGATLVGKYLIFLGGNSLSRNHRGIYIFNTETKLFEFAPVTNNVQFNLVVGAIYYDGDYRTHLSYQTSIPAVTAIGQLSNNSPSTAYYITEPKGTLASKTSSPSNDKNGEAAKFTILEGTKRIGPTTNTYTVALKIYNYKRNLWNYAQTTTGCTTTAMVIDGTVNTGCQIGDEVTILQGINAGLVCHIKNITNQGSSIETWILDTTLPSPTEANIQLSVCPFKLVDTFTFNSGAELRNVYFDIKNKYRGKRFLLKLLFTGISNTELDITDGQFIFNDQGVITT